MPTRSTRSQAKPDTGSKPVKQNVKKQPAAVKDEPNQKPAVAASTPRKRKRAAPVKRESTEIKPETDEHDHPLKQEDGEEDDEAAPPPKKPSRKATSNKSKQAPKMDLEAGAKMAASHLAVRDTQAAEPPAAKAARAKNNPYGLSPGESPFPTYAHPTPEECQQVNDILSKAHGAVAAPKTIPTPSLNSSGCGEVPSVLDALVRTRLSAATNNANSSRAFRGLVETFGIIKQGIGKGSVDWNKVRTAPQKQVFEAIKSGGLADVKSRDIQKILHMVHDENQADRAALTDSKTQPADAKQTEIDKAAQHVLSLDHLHAMGSDEAFQKLLGYPGIGPKTASCVLLFCMQRPSFAVDTHVFRLTRWLGWMPSDAGARAMAKRGESRSAQVTRNSTYAHLDVRIPDHLKYPLHYLLIRHGKDCGWCSAKAGKDRRTGTCPLAGLMKGKGRSKGSAKKVKDEDEEGEDEDGLEVEEDEDEEGDEMHGMA